MRTNQQHFVFYISKYNITQEQIIIAKKPTILK
jgi:hypothetical protein